MDNPILVAGTLVVVVNRIVEAIAQPLRAKKPDLDLFWLMYVSWALSAVLIFTTGANVFPFFAPPYEVAGQVLSAIAIGGGSNILSDVLDKLKASARADEAKAPQT